METLDLKGELRCATERTLVPSATLALGVWKQEWCAVSWDSQEQVGILQCLQVGIAAISGRGSGSL